MKIKFVIFYFIYLNNHNSYHLSFSNEDDDIKLFFFKLSLLHGIFLWSYINMWVFYCLPSLLDNAFHDYWMVYILIVDDCETSLLDDTEKMSSG